MPNLMDVLKPDIFKIDGKRYRKPLVKTSRTSEEDTRHGAYYEDDLYYDDEPLSCEAEYCNIIKVDNGYKETIKDIPSFYFRFIIGVGNEKRKKLEQQTKTSIQVPKHGCDGDIVITGKERSGIIAARTKIKTIFEMNRGEAPAAHFLNIQITSNEITENFEVFKEGVLDMKLRGMDKSLFQFPERLHLTLCLLTFLNDAELNDSFPKLSSVTEETQIRYLGVKNAIKIRIQGVEYMNDDPGEVDVLYAKVNIIDGSDKFQYFVDEVVAEFSSLGYLKKEHERVKLHATIINSLFRDDKISEPAPTKGSGNKRNRITFNAKPILDTYSDFFFGDMSITSLDIAVRRTFDADGRYKVAVSIPLC